MSRASTKPRRNLAVAVTGLRVKPPMLIFDIFNSCHSLITLLEVFVHGEGLLPLHSQETRVIHVL